MDIIDAPQTDTPTQTDPLAELDVREWHELPARLTVPEAARVARVTPRTIARWRSAGLLRVLRPAGGRVVIPRDNLRALMEASR